MPPRWPRARQPGLGFIKIEANGHGHSVAKLTRPGLVALVLRLSRFMPVPHQTDHYQ